MQPLQQLQQLWTSLMLIPASPRRWWRCIGLDPLLAWGVLTRGLGVVYAIAFASIAVQIRGLAGRDGMSPFAPMMQQMAHDFPGWRRLLYFPTLLWLTGGGDAALVGLPVAGVGFWARRRVRRRRQPARARGVLGHAPLARPDVRRAALPVGQPAPRGGRARDAAAAAAAAQPRRRGGGGAAPVGRLRLPVAPLPSDGRLRQEEVCGHLAQAHVLREELSDRPADPGPRSDGSRTARRSRSSRRRSS